MSKIATIKDVAALTGLGWDTVKEIHKSYLGRKYKKIKFTKVRYIAIDEIYLGKKRKYITIVVDLETGQVLHVGHGKGKDALTVFWRRLKRSRAKVEAVSTDMASGYMAAVLEQLPKADLVLDHFHLVKWFNDKLTLLRRQMYSEAETKDDKDVLKGSRWLLLKAPENLKSNEDVKKDECIRLEKALEMNKPLATAYYMKERLRLMFQCTDKAEAENELDSWISEANSSDIKILQDAAKKLMFWKPFVLNWYKHKISSAKIEATNRKIGLIQRNAHGYRDEEYLKLRIYNIHNCKYSLTG